MSKNDGYDPRISVYSSKNVFFTEFEVFMWMYNGEKNKI